MVGSIQNVKETQLHELAGSLEPARIQVNEAGISKKFKCSDRAARRQKTKRDDDPRGQAVKRGMNREARPGGLNRVLEKDVQHQLVPKNRRAIRELGTG